MTDLRPCCQQAVLDGTSPVEHYDQCEARAEDPQSDVLFDLDPTKTQERGPQL